MKKTIIIIGIVILLVILGVGAYFLFASKNNAGTGVSTGTENGDGTLPPAQTTGGAPANLASLPAIGSAAQMYSNLPTSTQFSIGTPQGTVLVNNFYNSNPPVVDGGDIIVKATTNYVIAYDPSESSFWLGIGGSPFATWQNAAEQDFLATLGVSKADACKLDVTSGVIYSAGNPLDGQSFPLSFCAANSAF